MNERQALCHDYWNEALNRKWLSEADAILACDVDFISMRMSLSPAVFDEPELASPAFPCAPETYICISKRK
jgi:hypothetical protein